MNITVAVAIITGLSAIIPSFLNTYLNNKYQLKLKKYETDNLAKRQAILDFTDAVSECFSYDGGLPTNEIEKYNKTANKLLLFFPDLDTEQLEKIRKSLYSSDRLKKQKLLIPLIKKLSKSIFEK